jgi:chromate reductase, NAD(P)H dehydrogenase (quinone)
LGTTPKILAFAGSLRAGSYNKKLAKVAAEAARAAGAEVTLADLKDLPLPVFDQDIEQQSFPENAIKLKALMKAHDGFLMACPEYNSSISAALKNAIDWASRERPDEKPLECFDGKVAALMSASPGALGGLRGLVTVRMILGNIRVIVLPEQVAISQAHQAFNEAGSLVDPKRQASIEKLAQSLVAILRKLHA